MPGAGILVSLWWALFRNIVVSCHSVLNNFDQLDLQDLETLGPLVAPSLRSGHYSPRAFGSLNPVDPSVSLSNYH